MISSSIHIFFKCVRKKEERKIKEGRKPGTQAGRHAGKQEGKNEKTEDNKRKKSPGQGGRWGTHQTRSSNTTTNFITW